MRAAASSRCASTTLRATSAGGRTGRRLVPPPPSQHRRSGGSRGVSDPPPWRETWSHARPGGRSRPDSVPRSVPHVSGPSRAPVHGRTRVRASRRQRRVASCARRRHVRRHRRSGRSHAMSLIKPRTRGKQLVRHRTRLDRETNETLYAYAAVPRRADRVRAEPGDRHRAREGQGVPAVARRRIRSRTCRALRRHARHQPARDAARAPCAAASDA